MPTALRTLIAFCCLAMARVAEGISATQKVIELLSDMQAKAKNMKKVEAVDFSKFSQFCKNKLAVSAKEVKDAAELMETLVGDTTKLGSDIEELGEKVGALHKEVASNEKKLQAAKDQHERDTENYSEQIQDLSESVDALEGALSTMKKQNYDRKQAGSALLQLTDADESPLPESVRRTVMAFVAMSTDDQAEAPESNGYEFQSGGILDMLDKLHGEFKTKKAEAEKEKMNAKNAYQMVSQDLHDLIENAKADIIKKITIKEDKIQTNTEKKKNLRVTTASHKEDTKYLNDLTAECSQKKESFTEKQSLRTDEIEAIGKALEILKSPDVLGSAEEHLPSALMQSATATSFAHLRTRQDLESPEVRLAAARFLYDAGQKQHSQTLSMIAEKVAVVSDPFTKVKKMVGDMITRLLEESNQESEQKGFCDKELGTNQKTRSHLQSTIDQLTAKIDEGDAIVASTTQRVGELSTEVMALQQSMQEATELRIEERGKNKATVKDAKEALKAIEAATAVLKDFYKKASAATALLQEERPTMGSAEWEALANPNFDGTVDLGHTEGMQTFGKKNVGMQDEAGGVFAMLEVIASDFSTLEADTTSSEATAAQVHKDFLADSQKAIAVKTKESDMLSEDRATAKSAKASDTKDMKATEDQLLAAGRYYDKLKPTCVDNGISYGDRVAAREAEIQSLQEALQILAGQ